MRWRNLTLQLIQIKTHSVNIYHAREDLSANLEINLLQMFIK